MHRSPLFYTGLKSHRYFSTKPSWFLLISDTLPLLPHLQLSRSTPPMGFKTHNDGNKAKIHVLCSGASVCSLGVPWEGPSLPWLLPWGSCTSPLPLWPFILFPSKESFSLCAFRAPRMSPSILYTRFQQIFHIFIINILYLMGHQVFATSTQLAPLLSPKLHRRYVKDCICILITFYLWTLEFKFHIIFRYYKIIFFLKKCFPTI